MLTSSGGSLNADGGKINQNLADVICERSLMSRKLHGATRLDIGAKCW